MKREELEQKIKDYESQIKTQSKIGKSLKKELKVFKKQLEELPKLEVVKHTWYKHTDKEGDVYLIAFTNDSLTYVYGFFRGDRFSNWHWDYKKEEAIIELAPLKEVQTALIEEAKKRGFKEGVRFNSVDQGHTSGYLNALASNNFECTQGTDRLHCNGYTAYYKGKWATIIEQKKVSISGDYTKEDLEKIIQTEFNQ